MSWMIDLRKLRNSHSLHSESAQSALFSFLDGTTVTQRQISRVFPFTYLSANVKTCIVKNSGNYFILKCIKKAYSLGSLFELKPLQCGIIRQLLPYLIHLSYLKQNAVHNLIKKANLSWTLEDYFWKILFFCVGDYTKYGWHGLYFACGIWCLADVSSVSPSSEETEELWEISV